jgi:hypothetical protein
MPPPTHVEGRPFGGADLAVALAAAGLDFPLQSETIGCKGIGTGATTHVYGSRSGPQFALWVYRTVSELHDDWDVRANRSPVSKGISPCLLGESAVAHENLLLDFGDSRYWDDVLRQRVTDVLLALDPATVPSRVALGHPPGTRLGVDMVDALVEAYITRNAERYRALARCEFVPCALTTTNDWYGPPPRCPDGVSTGTPLEIMIVSSCHGAVLTREDLARETLRTGALDVRLYAVAKASGHPDPRVEYLVFFASRLSRGKHWGIVYEVGDGGFTSYHGGCGGPPPETITPPTPGEFLLPPP